MCQKRKRRKGQIKCRKSIIGTKKSLSLAATAEFCMKKNPTNSDMRLLLTVRGNKYLEFAKVRMNENWSQGSQSASKRHRQKIPQFLLVLGCPFLSLALIEINWIQKSEIGNSKAKGESSQLQSIGNISLYTSERVKISIFNGRWTAAANSRPGKRLTGELC